MPDTLDGRFAVLATVTRSGMVRLERDGKAGNDASVALSERFIEVMESEHRELGLGDPTLGKTVRKLVGMLGRRVELWRRATAATATGGSDARKPVQGARCRKRRCATARQRSATYGAARGAPLDELEQGNIA